MGVLAHAPDPALAAARRRIAELEAELWRLRDDGTAAVFWTRFQGRFRRVHRSAIVRLDRAREIRRSREGALTVVTGLGAAVRVGRTFAPGLLLALEPHATL